MQWCLQSSRHSVVTLLRPVPSGCRVCSGIARAETAHAMSQGSKERVCTCVVQLRTSNIKHLHIHSVCRQVQHVAVRLSLRQVQQNKSQGAFKKHYVPYAVLRKHKIDQDGFE